MGSQSVVFDHAQDHVQFGEVNSHRRDIIGHTQELNHSLCNRLLTFKILLNVNPCPLVPRVLANVDPSLLLPTNSLCVMCVNLFLTTMEQTSFAPTGESNRLCQRLIVHDLAESVVRIWAVQFCPVPQN